MLNEKFEIGDTVRILTVPEMMQHLNCTSTKLHDEYDWNDRNMSRFCGKVGPIIGASIGPDAVGVFGIGREVTFGKEEN